jgi:hypothetical protein
MALNTYPPDEIEAGGIVTIEITDDYGAKFVTVSIDGLDDAILSEPETNADGDHLVKWSTSGLEAGSYVIRAQFLDEDQKTMPDKDEIARYTLGVRPISADDSVSVDMRDVERRVAVALQRIDFPDTVDQALWPIIRKAVESLSFSRYQDWIDKVVCAPGELERRERAAVGRVQPNRALPFPDIDPYRLLKVATEVFLMINCGVALERNAYENLLKELGPGDRERLGVSSGGQLDAYWRGYLQRVNGFYTIPYLDIVRRKLGDIRLGDSDRMRFADRCYGILREKFTRPCLIELIWCSCRPSRRSACASRTGASAPRSRTRSGSSRSTRCGR